MFGKKQTETEKPPTIFEGKHLLLYSIADGGEERSERRLKEVDDLIGKGYTLVGISGTYYKFAVLLKPST